MANSKIYFAGPLFNYAEKAFNLEVAELLEKHGYCVFLPQRDGIIGADLAGKTEEEINKLIFTKDYDELIASDIVFANLDGRVPDEGTCIEIGIAYAKNKVCYGIKTDTRAIIRGVDLNSMITGCLKKIFKNTDGKKALEELDAYLSQNTL